MNKEAELISMKNLTQMSREWLKKCFDYSLKTSEPTNINGRYQITLTVITSLNLNFSEFNKYIIIVLNRFVKFTSVFLFVGFGLLKILSFFWLPVIKIIMKLEPI